VLAKASDRGGRTRKAGEIYIIFIIPAVQAVSILYVPLAILTAARGVNPPGSGELRWRTPRGGLVSAGASDDRSLAMLDAVYLAIGFGFVVIAVLYVVACDRI